MTDRHPPEWVRRLEEQRKRALERQPPLEPTGEEREQIEEDLQRFRDHPEYFDRLAEPPGDER